MLHDLQTILRAQDRQRTAERSRGVGPSDFGSCPRQVGYRERGQAEDTPRDKDDATAGTLLHAGFASALVASGAPVEVERVVTIPGLKRTGTCDAYWYDDAVVEDFKTKSGRGFQRWLDNDPDESAWGQVYVYAYGLWVADEPVHTVRITAYNRETGAVQSWDREFDPHDDGIPAVRWLMNLQEQIDSGADLPRTGPGPERGFPCDWCPFVRTCWNLDVFDTGSAVAQFTTDEDVPALLAQYDEGRALEAKGKRLKEEARDRLVGREGVTEDGWEFGWTGGREVREEVVDMERVAALLADWGLAVPVREEVRSTRRSISVRRVRPKA